ncbi:MAG: 50S ribosomal protein L25/general stress protein Ctc [Spongiibacteraceae bacterium]
MATDFKLSAKARTDVGKGASRRLRRLVGEIPAIVYGGEKAPQMLNVSHKDLSKALEDESFYSHIITLDIEGVGAESVVLKALQRHPAKPYLLHADFLRVDATHAITLRVPLHFLNAEKCVGVRLGGGTISHAISELEVRCLPKDLPEFIEVDLAELAVGQIIHISELTLPAGVESVQLAHGADHDLPVVTVMAPRGGADEEAKEEA